jgi:hypothetical protein
VINKESHFSTLIILPSAPSFAYPAETSEKHKASSAGGANAAAHYLRNLMKPRRYKLVLLLNYDARGVEKYNFCVFDAISRYHDCIQIQFKLNNSFCLLIGL